ncbi:minor capsid protein [Secundilactobacillus pentosiphilus]|uniref:Minor capsid protein n=1 Tax=Secundilactobacillus pentosiphilus TaxID=1714682 RepID=A0A1Z5IYR5_9LACO|nr:minor capsid protein [Secundilactobacillus pentosiphilus]
MSLFDMNYLNKYYIDTNRGQNPDPKGDDVTKAKWAPLAAGINTVTPASSDTTDNTPYYDGDGFTDTDVTGKAITLAFSGNRVIGDPAQEFVSNHFLSIGANLKTLAKWVNPQGQTIYSNVTLTAIVPTGGAANVKQTFSFTMSFNGKPFMEDANGQDIQFNLDSYDGTAGVIDDDGNQDTQSVTNPANTGTGTGSAPATTPTDAGSGSGSGSGTPADGSGTGTGTSK